jgi:hypothetical protein
LNTSNRKTSFKYSSALAQTSVPASINSQANNTQGLGPGHNRGKAKTNPGAIPELVKNFKKDVLRQAF